MAEEANRVRVAVRCRPLNRRELEMKDSTVIDVTSGTTLSLRSRGTEEARPFTFDRCFGEDSTQEVREGVRRSERAREGNQSERARERGRSEQEGNG